MIFIDRNQVNNEGPIQPGDAWFEGAQELTNQAIADGPDHEIDDHYKDAEVKKALEKLFHFKCAYCEGEPASQGPWDVEHYRPKGRVRENKNHPGYYWLAYTWTNLLPSCVFCNQRRVDQPTFDDPVALPSAGKLDQFPLADETRRAMTPNDPLEEEEPLLLNPCEDEDCEDYFRYDIQGFILSVEENNDHANKTIEICNLNRRRLREPRRNEIVHVAKAVRALEESLRTNNAALIGIIQEVVDEFLGDHHRFAGAARYVNLNHHTFIA